MIDEELGLCLIAVQVVDSRSRTVEALNIGLCLGVCPAAELKARFLAPILDAQEQVRPDLHRTIEP